MTTNRIHRPPFPLPPYLNPAQDELDHACLGEELQSREPGKLSRQMKGGPPLKDLFIIGSPPGSGQELPS